LSRVPITLPELGTAEAVFGLWHVAVGDRVSLGERLAEVLIPGVVVELQAGAAGVLAEATVQTGAKLSAGEALGSIEAE
jgi:2-oxoglutarate dehydrogenase E2 component (dihydrolipoamide succinyltransferase)/2-oxoisovalerate dehydrogenase E2 component (dihydrolipoyl transacylase)